MSQLATVCRNKVKVELKVEIESLSRQRAFYSDIAEEECKEDYRNTLNSVAAMIKGKWQRNFVATIFLLSQHKSDRLKRGV